MMPAYSRRLLLALSCFLYYAGIVQAQDTESRQGTSAPEDPPPVCKSDQNAVKESHFCAIPLYLANDILAPGELDRRDEPFSIRWQPDSLNPYTAENECKDEYYRRKRYADEHFSGLQSGSKTERGRFYIIWGAPDSILSHKGGLYPHPPEEGGEETLVHPFERWRYRQFESADGCAMEFDFVDSCECGDYFLADSRSDEEVDDVLTAFISALPGAVQASPAIISDYHDGKLQVEVYNLGLSKSETPSVMVQYRVVSAATGEPVFENFEYVTRFEPWPFSGPTRNTPLTLSTSLRLDPGVYDVSITVNDLIAHRSITPTARFAIK